MNKYLLLVLAIVINLNCYSQDNKYLPVGDGEIVYHQNYILSYSEKHEQASWVAYELTASETNKQVHRSNNFRSDPSVETGSANLADYRGSGFDRGHLAPAADMSFSSQAMSESFFLSNMAPQTPTFNRGIWKDLESQFRNWARTYGKIYIVTGGIFTEPMGYIGRSNVSIPNKFYKIAFKQSELGYDAIAFILDNNSDKSPYLSHVVSIDDIEVLTGVDFFSQLPNDTEDGLESRISKSNWNFNVSNKNLNQYVKKGSKPQKIVSTDGRCCAITQKGTRCKRRAGSGSKYCWQHKKMH
jgi:endonuclease G